MTYSQLIQRLFQVNLHQGVKLELENMQRLQALFNYPDHLFQSIHVAGTNGKGSVSTKIAKAFEQAGYQVGLYTSPHLSCFRERMRINGEMIAEKEVEKYLKVLFEMLDIHLIPATFFEITTFLAFLYFAEQKVDVVVFETGLGGRLDATNVITPILSVITSISLDHTDILGSTIEAIALEKAGIIKENVPVVIGPHVPLNLIQAVANQKQALCLPVQEIFSSFEEENKAVAQAALNYLAPYFNLSSLAVKEGLKAKQPCRFEIKRGHPTVILDVAHNPDGLKHLFQRVKNDESYHSIRVLGGLSKSKDIKACLEILTQYSHDFHLVEAPNGRGVPVQDLYFQLSQMDNEKKFSLFKHFSIAEAVEIAQGEALKHHQVLVICGSFFIMSEARQALGYHEPCDAIDFNERFSNFKN